jgi:hypothetical protein
MVKIATRTEWIIVKYVYYRSFISENFPKFVRRKGRGMGGVTSARNERHTVSPEILKKKGEREMEVGHRTLCYVKSTIHRYLTVYLVL